MYVADQSPDKRGDSVYCSSKRGKSCPDSRLLHPCDIAVRIVELHISYSIDEDSNGCLLKPAEQGQVSSKCLPAFALLCSSTIYFEFSYARMKLNNIVTSCLNFQNFIVLKPSIVVVFEFI